MAKAHIVKDPLALKVRECVVCHKRFKAGETIYKTTNSKKAYCKSCYERMLH